MLKEIYLINSAQFDYAQVNLENDLFFLGDNGSGKTSFIRAIHFLYSGDTKSVGIPSDKESFKEYYFKYENSYIVYSFEDFFIFVYRNSNDIVKYFSKQKFDIDAIIHPNREVKSFKEIRSYIRQAPLYKRVSGVDEYTSIIYGQNPQYIDFAFSHIKNKKIFLKLYNSIFNIDKAIIDTKSIKQALFTSLDLSSDSAFFDPQEYIVTINEFIEFNRLFRAFDKNDKRIEDIVSLKDRLLEDETKLIELSKELNYRLDYEKNRLKDISLQEESISKEIEDIEGKIEYRKRLNRHITNRCRDYENSLILDLKEIQRLKERFSDNILQKSKELVSLSYTVEEKKYRLLQEKIELESGIKSEAESIKSEILELKRQKSQSIPFQKEQKEQSLLNDIYQKEQKEQERLKAKFEEFVTNKDIEIEEIEQSIDKINSSINELNNLLGEFKEESYTLQSKAQEEKKEVIEWFYTQKDEIESQKIEIKDKIVSLKREKENLQREFKSKKQKFKKSYENKKESILQEIEYYKNLLHTEPKSFKAFLEEEVQEWQKSLYPLIDKSLLNKSIEELKPKIVSKPIIGIDIDISNLNTLPTHYEIEEKLEKLNEKLSNTKTDYELQSQKIIQEYEEKLSSLELEIEKNRDSLSLIEDKLQILKSKKEDKLVYIKNILTENISKLKTKEEDIQHKKETLKQNIIENQNRIKEIKSEIKSKKIQIDSKLKSIKRDYTLKKEIIKRELKEWQKEQESKIDNQIALLKSKINTIQKDERLLELSKEIEKLTQKESEINRAKSLLEEYQESKESIDKELQKRTLLKSIRTTKARLQKRFDERLSMLLEQKENLLLQKQRFTDEKQKINKGLEATSPNPISSDSKESNKYLIELKEEYNLLFITYKENIFTLKSHLSRINSIPNLKRLDNIYFDISLFNKEEFLGKIASILANIDNLYEFKRSKLEILKQSQHTKFKNFINNLFSKKLEIFSSSEDKFVELIEKINSELKKVDFGVISNIGISTSISDKNSIANKLELVKKKMLNLSTILSKESLFFDRRDSQKSLEELEELFIDIKNSLRGDKISLFDTIELGLSFTENGKRHRHKNIIKNESSTGGSMLLKIALAISILKVYLKESKGDFFLIIDEVARLHTNNQQKLKEFANSSGFRIIFVTPEPLFADKESMGYYKFIKTGDRGFDVIALNRVINH